MKRLLITLTLATTAAMAADTALVTKSSGGGFVPPQYKRSEQCKVFPSKVVITRNYGYLAQGGATLTEVRQIQLKLDAAAVLAAADKEALQEGNVGPCDIPGTSIVAGKDTLLYQNGSCGSKTKFRDGAASRMLTEIVDLYCPKTHGKGFQE